MCVFARWWLKKWKAKRADRETGNKQTTQRPLRQKLLHFLSSYILFLLLLHWNENEKVCTQCPSYLSNKFKFKVTAQKSKSVSTVRQRDGLSSGASQMFWPIIINLAPFPWVKATLLTRQSQSGHCNWREQIKVASHSIRSSERRLGERVKSERQSVAREKVFSFCCLLKNGWQRTLSWRGVE